MLETNNDIVCLQNIHKTYLLGIEGVPALRGVSLNIKRGQWVALYGNSGGGKTSLLNLIGTIDKPTKGHLTICNKLINMNTDDDILAEIRLNHLGFVFQTFNLLGNLTAMENVMLPMILQGKLTSAEQRERAINNLKRVGLENRLDHFPNMLSGGEQQRVTIARAIANNPEILLLDEPTGDLDTVNTNRVIELLYELNEQGVTLIMVTHDVYLKNFAHRVVYMRDGKISKDELIPTEVRKLAFSDLGERIEKQKRLVDTSISKHGNMYPSVDDDKKKDYVTEVRDPTDYKTFRPRPIREPAIINKLD